ncbi:hypothetical protein F0562_002680 [Nyssa sinensis]|uniref:Uncharacterized protein n=1 Tax=Nyssa sinensis TaxID=561372 RepID=A0A5J5BZ70_9ASTE|nr:hypothetical protein F0562_002680 [Nyssa sinensis]
MVENFPKFDGRSTTKAEGWSSSARLGGGQVCSAWATASVEGCCGCRLGDGHTVIDRPFQEDNEVMEENGVETMTMKGVNVNGNDGSNIQENLKTSQEIYKEQLVDKEDAFVSDVGFLASAKAFMWR